MDATAGPTPPRFDASPPTAPPTSENSTWKLNLRRSLVWPAMLAACVATVVWPGDIDWTVDPPALLINAFLANEQHVPAGRGLMGNFKIAYGPLPTHVYQVLLLLTHDPIAIAALRAALCSGVTTLSLVWLARTLRLTPWFAAAVMFAPYVNYYHRILWDASFAVPIGSLALAAYAAFLRHGGRASLTVATAATLGLLLIHPQDLPVVVPLAAHLLWRRRSGLRQHWLPVFIVVLAIFVLNGPYIVAAFAALAERLGGAVRTGYPEPVSPAAALLGPLLSGRLFAGGDPTGPSTLWNGFPSVQSLARLASCIIFPLIWIGIGVATWRTYVQARGSQGRPASDDDGTGMDLETARGAVCGIALAGLACQMALAALMRVPANPQYFFGTFILHVMFAWLAVDVLGRLRLGGVAVAVYGGGVAVVTLAGMWSYHGNSAFRGPMGPTLANQVEVVRALSDYDDPKVLSDVPDYLRSSRPLRALRLLIVRDPARSAKPAERLLIRYGLTEGTAGQIELVPEPADLPADAWPIDVTPLRAAQ